MRKSHARDEGTLANLRHVGTSGESFGGDDLGAAPVGERLAGHARCELDRPAPQAADACRAGETQAQRGLAIDDVLIGVGIGVAVVGGTRIGGGARGSNEALEVLDAVSGREIQPVTLVGRGRDAADGARLRPRDVGAVERCSDRRQRIETLCQPRRGLDRARGDAETLACVVREPHEPETAVRAPAQQEVSDRSELDVGLPRDAHTLGHELPLQVDVDSGAPHEPLRRARRNPGASERLASTSCSPRPS